MCSPLPRLAIVPPPAPAELARRPSASLPAPSAPELLLPPPPIFSVPIPTHSVCATCFYPCLLFVFSCGSAGAGRILFCFFSTRCWGSPAFHCLCRGLACAVPGPSPCWSEFLDSPVALCHPSTAPLQALAGCGGGTVAARLASPRGGAWRIPWWNTGAPAAGLTTLPPPLGPVQRALPFRPHVVERACLFGRMLPPRRHASRPACCCRYPQRHRHCLPPVYLSCMHPPAAH